MIPQDWIDKGLDYLRKNPDATSCVAYGGYVEMVMLRSGDDVTIIEGSNHVHEKSAQVERWMEEAKTILRQTKDKFLYRGNDLEGVYFNFESEEAGYHIQWFKVVNTTVVRL